jgi:hypothetical protein
MGEWHRRLLAAAIVAGLGAPTMAQVDQAVFDFSVRGVRAGTLTFSGEVTDRRYSVSGRLESAGLVGLIRSVRYDGQAQGSHRAGRYTPARYVEKADTGTRVSEAVMEYKRGVPQVKVYNPPREAQDGGLDPSRQGGTVDPLTAMFATLRDVPKGQECNIALTLFDGKRRSQVSLGPPMPSESGVTCAGEYRRLEGFSPDDMAERSRFPFTVYMVPAEGGLMRVAEVRMESIYGNARLKRR